MITDIVLTDTTGVSRLETDKIHDDETVRSIRRVFTVQRLSDLGLMPKILLASAVISRLGRVLPLAIMCHLTST